MKVVLPKHLTDIEAIELIWGPPPVILTSRADSLITRYASCAVAVLMAAARRAQTAAAAA